MDKSLSNFELADTPKEGSEHGSDKSETVEIESLGDTDQSSSNGAKSDDDFDHNLPETVTLLRHEATGAKIYLVGTAHFSLESNADVIKVIENVQPHIVVLELCSSRTNLLTLDEKTMLEEAKNINFQKIIASIKVSGLYNGIMYILLLNMSAKLTKKLGMAPGGEFRAAFQQAVKLPNCEILLGDRILGITLKRALSRLTWFQTAKLAWHLLTSQDEVSVDDIEKCKNRDMIEQLLAELAGEYPAFRDVFLTERDIFLTNSLQSAIYRPPKKGKSKEALNNDVEPKRIVGVVGIGHVPGIVSLWPYDQSKYIAEIIQIPPPSWTSTIIKFSFRTSLAIGAGYLIYRYIPVPKGLKENAHVAFSKMIDGVKSSTTTIYID